MRIRALTLSALALAAALPGCKGCHETGLTGQGKTGEEEEEDDAVFSADWGRWLSLAATPESKPALSFYDGEHEGLGYAVGTILGPDEVEWEFEGVDGYVDSEGMDVGDRGMYTALAIASDGRTWIAYRDNGAKTLRYATRAAGETTWTTGIADVGGGSEPDAGMFNSLALDDAGAPVIAHHDEGKGHLRVVHSVGTGFSGEVVDEGEAYTPVDTADEPADADVGEFASIAIAGGVEYIAYYDRALGDLKLAVGTAGSYSVEKVDTEGDVGAWPDLMIDGSTVYIAYQDLGNQDLKLASGGPGAWTIATLDDDEYKGADTALYMNGSFPAVLYFDGRHNDLLSARFNGTEWNLDSVAGSDRAVGYHNEVATISGTHYGASYDFTNRTVWFAPLD